MSTDIVRWNADGDGHPVRTVSSEALSLYLQITLPLMVITFGGWYGVYWWVNTKDKPREGGKFKIFERTKRLKRAGTA